MDCYSFAVVTNITELDFFVFLNFRLSFSFSFNILLHICHYNDNIL